MEGEGEGSLFMKETAITAQRYSPFSLLPARPVDLPTKSSSAGLASGSKFSHGGLEKQGAF